MSGTKPQGRNRPERPARLCTAELAIPVRPRDVNVRQSVFGGHVMDLVDRVACLAASGFASRPVVMASLDRMDFLAGIAAYQIIRLRARGTRSFDASIEVRVDVEGEDPTTGRRWPTSHAVVTLVGLGEDGRPATLPLLVPETPEERAEWDAAGRRREERLRALGRPAPDYDAIGPESGRHLAFEMSTEVTMPDNVNDLCLAQAGWLLAVLDKLAFVCASHHCGRPTVTASVEALSFGRPVRLGDVVVFKAFLTRAFHTSMEVRGEVWKRSPFGGGPEHVSTSYLTFVALDEAGRPASVPPVEPRSDFERRLFAEAAERRAARIG